MVEKEYKLETYNQGGFQNDRKNRKEGRNKEKR